ncbi:MAG: hypothetical protein Kow00114_39200 [Kiloniellaceae bacterium]
MNAAATRGRKPSSPRPGTNDVNDLASMVAEPAADDGIPLDLAPLLTPYRQHRRLTVRVVHLPARAELTRGVRNEDASWSLTPADLDGLALLLPDDVERPPSVAIRIVVIDKNENASIVGQFEVPLPRSARRVRTSANGDDSQALAADWQRRMDRRVAAALRLGRRRTAEAVAAAEAQWQAAGDARLRAQAEELERTWQQKLADALTQARAGWEAEQEQESAAHLAAAVAEAERNAAAAAETRLQEAEAAWRRAAEGEIAAARQQAADAQAAAERLAADLAAAEARLGAQEQAIELAWRQKVEAAQASAEAAARQAEALAQELEAARQQRAAVPAPQPAEDVEARVAREIEPRLAKARSEWRRESDAERAEAVAQAERRTQALADSRLRQAREAWEREARDALAVAEGKWKAEAARRLANAQAEWQRSTEAKAAAGRGTLRRTARSQSRKQLLRRAGQLSLLAGGAVALFFLYAEFKPLIWQWTPKLIALAGDLAGAAWAELRSLAAQILARL